MSIAVKNMIDAALAIRRTAPFARPSAPCSPDDFKRQVFEAATHRPAVGNVATLMASLEEYDLASVVTDHNKRVNFDVENICSLEYEEQDGHQFLVLEAGGDWEYPVTAYLYWTGTSLAGFVPVKGNTYNRITNSAFGSEMEGIANLPEDEALAALVEKYIEDSVDSDSDESPYSVLGIIEYMGEENWKSLFTSFDNDGYPSSEAFLSPTRGAMDIVKPDNQEMLEEFLRATSISK